MGGVAGESRRPLEAVCNISPSEVTRNSGDLSVLADPAYLPLIIGRTIPIFPGQSCFRFLATFSRGLSRFLPQKTTSSNFRGQVAAWGPDFWEKKKKKGGFFI